MYIKATKKCFWALFTNKQAIYLKLSKIVIKVVQTQPVQTEMRNDQKTTAFAKI